MNRTGSSLILFLIALPFLLLMISLFVRNGTYITRENKLAHLCEKQVLEASARLGESLAQLGKLNPVAATIIDSKRAILAAVASGALPAPVGLKIIENLWKMQKAMDRLQSAVKTQATITSLAWLAKPWPSTGVLKKWDPVKPKLHVIEKPVYQNEIGAPLMLAPSFTHSQRVNIRYQIHPSTFLRGSLQKPLGTVPPLSLLNKQCAARVFMSRLEGDWKSQIINPKEIL